MLSKVQSYIECNQLLLSADLHLVGLSGGAESVALLVALQLLGYRVEAAHCNFKLRGDESDRDEQFVRQLCEKLGVKLHIIHFDTKAYADLHQVSIEMAARDLRYGYFKQLCQDIGAADVCIAHHRDDAVETLLMNLLRGAGIHGLTGIRPKNGLIRRPLLGVSRQEILQFLEAHDYGYVTDSTNLEPEVLRNKLRLQVLPLLETIYPGATANIEKSARYLGEAEKMYDRELAHELHTVVDASNPGAITLSIAQLLQQPAPLTLLHEWLAPYGFGTAETEQIFACLHESGKVFSSKGMNVTVDREQLILFPDCQQQKPVKMPETGLYRVADHLSLRVALSQEVTVSKQTDSVTLDADKVQFPLTLRQVTTGDWFVPFGMTGRKLVSDFMTDNKLSALDKQQQLAVADATGAIMWLVGRRTDNRFRVSADTKRVLRLSTQKE